MEFSSILVEKNVSKLPSNILSSKVLRSWVIWGLATLFYFYDNLLQISPSAMKPELSAAFASTAEQFGCLSAYCLFAYGLMQIPAGILMDKFGPRKIVTLACAFCAVGSLIFGIATSLWEAKCGRFLIGIGASFAFVTCLKLVSNWFAANRIAFLTGLTAMVGFMGAVFGLSTVSKVVELLGWRASMHWGGLIGLALSVFLWLIIRDKPINENSLQINTLPINVSTSKKQAVQDTMNNILQGLLIILKSKRTWIAALYAGLMFVPTLAFGGLWGVPFLVEAHGFDRNTAGACVSLIFLGWVFGSPLWGYFSDYLGKRKLPMIISNVATLFICLGTIYLQNLPLYGLNILLFSLGFFSSGFLIAFTVVQESNPKQLGGTAIGFTNALNTLFGAVAQPVIGKILDSSIMNVAVGTLSGSSVSGERVFTIAQYQYAFITLPVCLCIALVMIFFLKEKTTI